MTDNTRNTVISRAFMISVTAYVASASLGLVTLATGGHQFSSAANSSPLLGVVAPFAQFVGGVFGLYAFSWVIAGAVYLACFGRLSRSWIVYITISAIIILSCLHYRALTMGYPAA